MPACSVLGLTAVSLTAALHQPQWSPLHEVAAQVRRVPAAAPRHPAKAPGELG